MTRPIAAIEHDLAKAREEYRFSGPTHAATNKCERLFAELQAAKREAGLTE